MFECALCRKEWAISTYLCDKCVIIRHAMTLYSPEAVRNTITRVYTRPDVGRERHETAVILQDIETKQESVNK